jgi:negative regulator of sigma E activity
MNEKLSAFLDNEATRDEADSVINALLRDESLRESWTRQHWIRTTLRAGDAEPAVAVDEDFSKRVMAAIEADEQPADARPRSDKVVPMRRPQRRWRGVAGLAAAASVAGVVLLTGNPFAGSNDSAEGTFATADNSSTLNRTQKDTTATSDTEFTGDWDHQFADFSLASSHPARMRTAASEGAAARSPDQWSVSDPAIRDELNGYLADHNGMARGYGMYGSTPALVRVAAYRQSVAQ